MPTRILDILERAFRYGLYAVLFTPFLFARQLIYPFITLKVGVFEGIAGLLAALYIILLVFGRLPKPRPGLVAAAFGALVLGLLLASMQGVDIHRSLWSTEERGIGLIALFNFLIFFFVLAEYGRFLPWERYWKTSLLVSSVIAAFAFVHMLVPAMFLEERLAFQTRPGSFLGNPTFLAAYLLPHFFFGLYFLFQKIRARDHFSVAWLSPVTAILMAVIFLTQTRGALLGLFAGLLTLGIYGILHGGNIRVGRFSLRNLGLAVLGFMLAFGILFWSTRAASIWQKVPNLNRLSGVSLQSFDLQPRLIALRIGWESFLKRPLLGYGFENFKYPFDERYDPKLLRSGFSETYFDKPHNIFLEFAVAGGVIGLLAYILFLAAPWYVLYKRKELAAFLPFGWAVIVSYAVQNAFVFDTFGGLLMFVIFIAFVASRENAAPAHPPVSRNIGYGIAGLALLAALGWVFAQTNIVYANYKQYWSMNYLLNNKGGEAVKAYHASVGLPVNPYRDATYKDFAAALPQMYTGGVEIPDTRAVVDEAMANLAGAIDRNPKDYFLRVTYADAATVLYRLNAEFIPEAEKQLDTALTLSPNRQQTYYAFAKIKMIEGKGQEALDMMQKAIDLDPQIPDSHFYYALIAFDIGRTKEGFVELETAERMGRNPKNGPEARIVANQYADAGQYGKAVQFYSQALNFNPDDLEAALKLGIVYFYSGDLDAARLYINKVNEARPLKEEASYQILKPILDELGIH